MKKKAQQHPISSQGQSKGITLQELYQKATAHYHAGNLKEAEAICNQILTAGPHGDSYNLLAHIAQQKNDHEKSISMMQKALQLNKSSPIYNNNFGNILFQQGKYSDAIDYFLNTIRYKPDFAEAYFNIALSQTKCGHHEKALPYFQKTVELSPDICDAHTNIGNIYMKMGQKKRAETAYRRALALRPRDIVVSINLSLALQALKEWDSAENVLLSALSVSPESPELLFNLGNLYQFTHKSAKAVACYQKALNFTPHDPKLLYNLGTTFMESAQYADALPYLEKTLSIKPDAPEALNNTGMVNYKLGDYKKALIHYKKAIEYRQDFFEAHNNIGLVYKLLEKKDKAMLHFQQAIELEPDFAEAFHNLAEVQRESHQFVEAFENSTRAIALDPDLTPAYTHHAYLLKWLCQWDDYDHIKDQLDRLVIKELEQGETVRETPFMNLIREDDPAYNRRVADHFARGIRKKAEHLNITFPARKSPDHGKITIGYLSSNFRYHPLAHLLSTLFRHHNRNEFQINCYSMGPDDGSEYRKRFEKDSDIFRDIKELNHAESALQIFNDKVDILVDLMGYTAGNRLEIAALRPAPLQVRYMGMPGTTGGSLFDYIIVDEIVLPRSQQPHYAEHFIYMPHSYQINDRSKKISETPVTRKMFNLPENSFVFCSFNTSYKIDPVIFSTWMDILKETKDSVLWLMPDIERAGENMKKTAARHGIDPERLILTRNIPLTEHLRRISLADLALDSRTVGGAATTSDALWGGLPVITLLGSRFISRMSASILSAIGLEELIAQSLDEYKHIAITLARNKKDLKALKKKLKANVSSCPLFDTLGFTLNLEKAFKKIWDIHVSGERPCLVDLKEYLETITTATALYPQEYGFPIKNILIP